MRFTTLTVMLIACVGKRASPRPVVDTASPPSHLDTASSNPNDTSGETGEPIPDGACAAWGSPEPVGQIADSSLTEISGLAASRDNPGVLWVLEDSGAAPVLTAINTTGATLGTLTFDGVDNQDWEDLALGPCGDSTCLWVGDFGDNGGSRETVDLQWAVEPEAPAEPGFSLHVNPNTQVFEYPEGPQDAEALVVNHAGEPHILTKRTDTTTRIYRVPLEADGPTTAVLLGTMSTGSVSGLPTATTAADLWPDESRILVRGYLYSFEVALDASGLDSAPSGESSPISTGLEAQGEAIAYDSINRAIWHVSEGTNPHLWRILCED